MLFAKRVYTIAAIYGLLVILPMYFSETRFSREHPPAITHPEFFYGFLVVALPWQILFLLLAKDPARYRTLMIPTLLEKALFPVAAIVLFIQGRIPGIVFGLSLLDLLFCLLFAMAYFKTHGARSVSGIE